MPRQLEAYQLIERSLIKKYRKEIWNPFIAGVKRYELVNEGDKIAVCISGGKDSWIMANLLRHLKRISDTNFELVYLCMDPGYKDINRKKIEDNALVFIRYGRVREKIYLGDFWISTVRSTPYKANNECALKWVKFMYNVYGDKYALQYIAYRNRELDKFMAEYEEKFNRETRKVLDEMGFGKEQSQTK